MQDVQIWSLDGQGEAIRGPILEPVPKTLYDDLLIGLLESGVVTAHYRGTTHKLRKGTLILCQPEETIAFEPIDGTQAVRICLKYPRSELQNIAAQIVGRPPTTLYFPGLIAADPQLATLVVGFRRTLETPASQLESSSCLHDLLTLAISRHTSPALTWPDIKPERALVKQVREYLDENYADNVALDQLARMVNLSTFHLNRAFRAGVGLPPHAYQTQVRIMRAKSFLAQGMPIGQVAVKVGFFDQSHLTNHFRRLLGYTPSVYQRQILRR